MKYSIFLILAISFSLSPRAQTNKLITGLITSASDHKPIEGASVWLKGTKNYSGSQADGIYYISVKPTDSVLVISSNGHAPAEIKLTGQTEYNISLRETITQASPPGNRRELRQQTKP
jgi:hypothetical protein